MALSPGTRLGPYEIVGPIGVGGMGEVYRAPANIKVRSDGTVKVLDFGLRRGARSGTMRAVIHWTDELTQILAAGGVR